MSITYQQLNKENIHRIGEIDRSEEFFESYRYQNGYLNLIADHQMVNGFDPEELQELINKQIQLLEDGGIVVGAFEKARLIGVASVAQKRRGKNAEYCKMDILYVSKQHRGKHLGQALVDSCKRIGSGFGASKLYISATPTKHTVDFYIKQGAVLCKEVDPELFLLEPEDIHMELAIL